MQSSTLKTPQARQSSTGRLRGVMHDSVDPRQFIGQQMTLSPIDDGDYSVMIAGLRAGRIMRTVRMGRRTVWFWTLTGPYLNSAGSTSSGEADSLLEAKAAFRQAFDRWLKWAVGKEKLAVWFA